MDTIDSISALVSQYKQDVDWSSWDHCMKQQGREVFALRWGVNASDCVHFLNMAMSRENPLPADAGR